MSFFITPSFSKVSVSDASKIIALPCHPVCQSSCWILLKLLDLSKLLLSFSKQNQAEVWPRLVEASALNYRCWMSQSTQCPGSVMPLATFLVIIFNIFFHCLLWHNLQLSMVLPGKEEGGPLLLSRRAKIWKTLLRHHYQKDRQGEHNIYHLSWYGFCAYLHNWFGMLVIERLGLLTLTQGSPCQKLLRMRMSNVHWNHNMILCPIKHYSVNINCIVCKYQPGFCKYQL